MTADSEPTRAEVDTLPGPVLLEFGTDWCPYCIVLRPTVAAVLRQYPDVTHIASRTAPASRLAAHSASNSGRRSC